VNTGVVALRIEARPLSNCVWLQVSSENGTTVLSGASRSSAGACRPNRAADTPVSGAASRSSCSDRYPRRNNREWRQSLDGESDEKE